MFHIRDKIINARIRRTVAYDRRIIINADPTNIPRREIASSHVELYESRQQTRLPDMGQAFDAVLNSRGEIWRDEKDLPDELIPRMKLRRGLSFSARGIYLWFLPDYRDDYDEVARIFWSNILNKNIAR